jgi:hypothetical protein
VKSSDESASDSVVDKRQYKLLAYKNQVIKRKSLTRDDDEDDKLLICEDLCSNNNSNNNNKIIKGSGWSMENNQSVVNDDDSFALKLESHLIDNNIEFDNNDESDNQARRKINLENPSTASSKFLNLRKKNGTSLVFQRKNCGTQQQNYQELEATENLNKRQSFHWPYKSVVNNHGNKFNKSRHFSWHDDACNYTQPIEEEYENSVS